VESALYVKKDWGTIYGALEMRYGRKDFECLQKEGSVCFSNGKSAAGKKKNRGAPKGHSGWNHRKPDLIENIKIRFKNFFFPKKFVTFLYIRRLTS